MDVKHSFKQMSHFMKKPTVCVFFFNRTDANQAVQAQKMARDWKFWIKKVEELYYPCRENAALIRFTVTVKLICAFVFS